MGFFKKTASNLKSGKGLFGLNPLDKDMLLGKEQDPYGPYKMLELDPELKKTVQMGRQAQQKGLGAIMAQGMEDIPGIVRGDVGKELRGLEASGADAARKVQESIAQRGMGKSSIGMGLEKGIQERTARAKASTMADIQKRIRAMKEAQQDRLIGAGGQVLGTPGAQRTLLRGQDKGRKGGLLQPLLMAGGGIAGGMAGGPGGAAAGMQMGSGLGQSLSYM